MDCRRSLFRNAQEAAVARDSGCYFSRGSGFEKAHHAAECRFLTIFTMPREWA